MWDLPGPGLKPMSPALAGGFLTTAPPGKSDFWIFLILIYAAFSYLVSLVNLLAHLEIPVWNFHWFHRHVFLAFSHYP